MAAGWVRSGGTWLRGRGMSRARRDAGWVRSGRDAAAGSGFAAGASWPSGRVKAGATRPWGRGLAQACRVAVGAALRVPGGVRPGAGAGRAEAARGTPAGVDTAVPAGRRGSGRAFGRAL
ncbi:hypothetical protein GCM10018793_22020 [Streptomyces sulfonofaciens]|uniref:Uncharacterized protein n=1 Tax=Streptomyces sulfonofaciens TaxID=68272 RepID=A0A919KXH1_9ACTN|nr:hypothetical protein GCM10018793_22020 [Streptomyces sulfonofaciens]